MHGFSIGFSGKYNEIDIGWYQNDRVHGNWMKVNASNFEVICSGWYKDGVRISEMKDHS